MPNQNDRFNNPRGRTYDPGLIVRTVIARQRQAQKAAAIARVLEAARRAAAATSPGVPLAGPPACC